MWGGLRKVSKDEPIRAEDWNRLIDEIQSADRLSSTLSQKWPRDFWIGRIANQGPNGEPDFVDARYWVVSVVFDPVQTYPPSAPGHPYVYGDPPRTSPQTTYDLDTYWSEYDYNVTNPPWIAAVNFDEVESGGHTLAYGTVVKINEMADATGDGRWYFSGAGGGVGGGPTSPAIEVKIHKVVNEQADCVGAEENALWDAWNGPMLMCYEVISYDGVGMPVLGTELFAVWPQGHQNSFFSGVPWRKADGSQIYNSGDPDDPVFPARYLWPAVPGNVWVLDFAIGITLVEPPDPDDLCP